MDLTKEEMRLVITALNKFKEVYGDDGNILAIGMNDSSLYTPENFTRPHLSFLEENDTLV